jgi:hypothetical protein
MHARHTRLSRCSEASERYRERRLIQPILEGRLYRFLPAIARWSWALLIFERPSTPSFLASA